MLCTKSCLFYFKEDSCGKDGRANLSQVLHLHEDTNWPELESTYRRNENAYDFTKNDSVSLEDWINFEAEVDRMFALVSELDAVKLQERLSKIQVSETHYHTCFLLGIIPHLCHKAFYFTKTPLTLIQELTAEEIQQHPKEDCRPRGTLYTRKGEVNLKHFSAQLYLQMS